LIDRRLYLPEHTWCTDVDRRWRAGVPAATTFATKPTLAHQMITAALDAKVPAGWVTGDEVYGADPRLRRECEQRGLGYALAVACDHRVGVAGARQRADAVAAGLPRQAWQRMSAGPGAKGPRFYDWAVVAIDDDRRRSLLMRRNHTTGELAFYRCFTPSPAPLSRLVAVAGTRWSIEEGFQAAKSQVGLDHYQVRGWTGWHRYITLAMLALAFLAVAAAHAAPAQRHQPERGTSPIGLTIAEIRRLFTALVIRPAIHMRHLLAWSGWRRHHQAHARKAHYHRRLAAHNEVSLEY
jgi:SRSO17 transposase